MHIRALLTRDLDAPWLAGRNDASRTQAELLVEALAVAASLGGDGGDHRGLRVAIACRSVRHFAPAFLGALAVGARVQLLPNTQLSTLERAAAASDFLLYDTETENASSHGVFLPPLLANAVSGPRAEPLPPTVGAARVILSTSGTTGHPGESSKHPAQLASETEALMALFSDAKCVLSTVPPFHLFGLLFGLLVPLRIGACIVEEPGFFLSDIASAIRAHAVDVLVSTPAHLSAMLQTEMPKGMRVFSSGARLPDVLHYALMATHDFHVTDILGSTETGGIASRARPLSRWTPLPGVLLTQAEVRSPWCDDGVQPLRDVITLAEDGTFDHAGRRDDVVKVAGKRASLAALEHHVRKIPGVTDVAIWQDTSSPGESRLRYAIACTQEHALTRAYICHAVTQEFDPVFVPRQVVFLDTLPREATGKLPLAALAALFRTEAKSFTTDPQLTLEADGRVSCTLLPSLIFFEGHFRGLPILPGTVLLDRVVVPAAHLAYASLGSVQGMQRIRFVRTVTPNQHLTVMLKRNGERISFEVTGAGGPVASGVLIFRPPTEPA